ncbi:hypothetical protein TRFO_39514 [Tritrichomonas foetus]|uniref:Uncharacterized protein n=1 Tax=Tritrichomonas foetus TaxID=1144522 RepID=A0A1J4J4K6_9EUKA|nr:hypothetical protein TRFO_39514 [Tritrichomonas foetus]|eukprot:OHS94282.1 hypothetical protein TRFO_39514 [Tritrichomonas foetus]
MARRRAAASDIDTEFIGSTNSSDNESTIGSTSSDDSEPEAEFYTEDSDDSPNSKSISKSKEKESNGNESRKSTSKGNSESDIILPNVDYEEKNNKSNILNKNKNNGMNKLVKISANRQTHYNIIVTHSRLETIEARISNSRIPNIIHPAQAIVYDKTHQESLKLTRKELEKRNHYKIIESPKRIPNFWEPRKWDTPDMIMNEDENEEIEDRIRGLDSVTPEGNIKKWYHSGNSRENSRSRKKRPNIPFVASLLDYNTDTFEDQTDIEFYDF